MSQIFQAESPILTARCMQRSGLKISIQQVLKILTREVLSKTLSVS